MNIKYTDKEVVNSLLSRFEEGVYFYEEGRVYRTKKKVNQSKEIVLSEPEVASHLTSRGYRRVYFHKSGVSTAVYEHRLIFAYFYGISELYNYQCIDHINGDREDNRVCNLRGLSIRENTVYAEANGLYKRTYGDINGQCKLSKGDIDDIRVKYKDGYTQKEVASLFNVSQSHISEIVNFKKRVRG